MTDRQQAIRTVKTIKSEPLQQQNIVIQQTQSKYIKVKSGVAYQVVLQKHDASLEVDFNVLAKKQGSDLVLLLDDETTVVFDEYFSVCLDAASSCMVSLPSDGGMYHVSDGQFKLLEDGTELVYFYGAPTGLEEIAANNSGHTLTNFIQQNQEQNTGYSPWVWGGGILVAAAAVGGGSGGGGGGDDSSVLFTILGDISLGQVIKGHDLTLKVYDKNGAVLEADITVEDDGSFTIKVKKEHAGEYLLLRVTDGSNKDYIDEGTGEEKDLTLTKLQTIIKADGKADITAMINPLTEIITRKVFNGNTDLKDVDDITADLATANTAVSKALNVEGVDISSTKPAVVNADSYDSSASADVKALGYALAGISGMETKDRDGDKTKTTDKVLDELVDAIDDNGVLNENTKADFLAGLKQAQSKNIDNMPDSYINQFETSISNIDISDDTVYNINTDSDFITKITAQTITAILKTALTSSEKLWGSVDSGTTWEEITVTANSTDILWNKDLQEGEHIIQFAITENTISTSEQVASNVKGTIALQSYTLDTTAPVKAIIEKAITNSNNNLTTGETTNDSTPNIRISLKDTGAKEGDRIQVLVDDGTGYTHSKYATLSQVDIDRANGGYKDVELSTLSVDTGDDNKTYSFQTRIVDEVGNQSALSDAYSIIYDGKVEELTLALKDDTGMSTVDGITNNKIITIGNIEKGAKVEYILDGGDGWITLTSTVAYDSDKKGTVEIELNENTKYAAGNIKVRQTDSVGNVNTENDIVKNSTWIIDNTAVEYDDSEDEKIFRVKNEDTNLFESHIVLTFTEDVVKLPTFDKNSFTIHIGSNIVANSDVKSVITSGNKVTIVMTADINTATELKLSYAQSNNDKALQDKAGNSLATISEQTFAIDNAAPTKPTIVSVIDNKGDSTGEVANNAITDDSSLDIKVTFTDAVKGDSLKYYNTKDSDKLLTTVVLTQIDIDRGYKITTLYLDSSVDGKDYILSTKVVDQTGNISEASDVKNFTVDAAVSTPSVKLKYDKGLSTADYITNFPTIEVSNIEKGATWKYSVDGGSDWTDGEGGAISDSRDTKHSFELTKDTTYDARDIRVRQTDKAQNEATSEIGSKVIIDNSAPELQSVESNDSIIILNFSEKLHGYSTTSSTAKNAFSIEGHTVSRVEVTDNKVHLSINNPVSDVDAIKISYTKPSTDTYQLKDIAGNLVNNLRIGTKDVDILVGTNSNDTFTGGSGVDTLTGNDGIDTFDYNATTDGNDTITDFTKGSDRLDIKDLLTGYDSSSTLSKFVISEVSNGNTIVKVDANGAVGNSGVFTADIEITLTGVTGIDLSTMLTSGDLIVL
ncbi:T1SS secreted agglutinin RTX [Bathymodiolus heckerae thiotrophic gill symbiont]|uniref:SwmB domain-containing protein n=1 Tax=Bathymodiolus heckerae thiotrophic gill symbiont TaxID=1052212 RepID=UPI0010B2BC0F|nr:SwmB domain-containing protein [Bathymodiolus heckerae thiotrophic gill symbiont]SMN13240.1 T1SS secreted agglutinin RTX [Bathymodiolus heckerae thiotrophic gill symbiont]